MSKRIGRPSPALIISIVALVAALGGGAYAATVAKNSVSAKSLKKNAVVTNKIKNAAVTKDKLADGAVTAEKIADPAMTIRAYAKVNQSGGFPSQTKNVTSIDHTATGRYCFDLPFTATGGIAAARGDDAAATEAAQPAVPAPTCPAGFQDAAVFVSDGGGAAADGGFFVWFN
jgi:hypothetical protein